MIIHTKLSAKHPKYLWGSCDELVINLRRGFLNLEISPHYNSMLSKKSFYQNNSLIIQGFNKIFIVK